MGHGKVTEKKFKRKAFENSLMDIRKLNPPQKDDHHLLTS